MTTKVRKLSKNSKCEYGACRKNSKAIVYSRNTKSVVLCCETHADIVVEEQCPEYTDECHNCGCMQGVN